MVSLCEFEGERCWGCLVCVVFDLMCLLFVEGILGFMWDMVIILCCMFGFIRGWLVFCFCCVRGLR